jgi:hypothetical protein
MPILNNPKPFCLFLLVLSACAPAPLRRSETVPMSKESTERDDANQMNLALRTRVMDGSVMHSLVKDQKGLDEQVARLQYWSQVYPDLPYLHAACSITIGDLYKDQNPGLANDYYQMISQSPNPELKPYQALALARLTHLAGRQAAIAKDLRLEATCIADRVRVRLYPKTSAPVVATVDHGRLFYVLEASSASATIGTETANWYNIESGSGTRGWVFGRFLDLNRHLEIDARHGWIDTGVDLLPNQRVRIEQESGLWTVNSDRYYPVDANGYIQEQHMPLWNEVDRKELWSVPFGALLASVGDKSVPFYIGRHGDFVPSTSGRLYLRINEKDEFIQDNAGAVGVFLTIQNQISGKQLTN